MKKHYRGSRRSDLVPVIYPVAYHPYNIVPGTQQINILFLVEGNFQVGQKITDLFKSVHSQGYKLIPGFPFSYFQGVAQCIPIQCCCFGIFGDNKAGSAFCLLYGYTYRHPGIDQVPDYQFTPVYPEYV